MRKVRIFVLHKVKEKFGTCAEELEDRFKKTSIELPTHEDLKRFKTLKTIFSNELRAKIVYLLAQEELPVCALVALLNKEQTLISHHLACLKRYDAIVERRVGKFRFYTLNKKLLGDCMEVIMKRLEVQMTVSES